MGTGEAPGGALEYGDASGAMEDLFLIIPASAAPPRLSPYLRHSPH